MNSEAMTTRAARGIAAIAALLCLAACGGGAPYLRLEADRPLNPLDGVSRQALVRVFLLEESNGWESATSQMLWPAIDRLAVPGCHLVKEMTLQAGQRPEERVVLSQAQAPNATRVGITANFADKSGAWKVSRPIAEVQGKVVRLRGIDIEIEGEPPPAGAGETGR